MASTRRTPLLIGIAVVVVLAIAGYFLFGAKKTRDLESSAGAGVADATQRLRNSLAAKPGEAGEADVLAADAAAIDASLARLRAEDASRNKALAEAAELYLVDVQAILKNEAAAARARRAWEASRKALLAHLDHAQGRGPGWIDRALALKDKAEKDNFEYRNALGTISDLLRAHQDTQATLRAAWPAAPVIEDEERKEGRKRAQQAVEQASEELQKLRQLPLS